MDADALARLVLHRCSDALNEAEIGDLTARLEGQVVTVTVLDHVMSVLAAFEERLARLEVRAPVDSRRRFGPHGASGAPRGVVNGDLDEDGVRPIRIERRK
jgi:hypothetical protein